MAGFWNGAGGAVVGAGSSLLGGLIGGWFQSAENRKMRQWQSEEAQLDRDFQAQQAQLGRDFTEYFYNQYQSPAAMIRQGTEAGLHPLFSVGVNPASGVSSPMPSGSRAGSVPQFDVGSTFSNAIQSALGFLEMKSKIDLNDNLGKLYKSQATGQDIHNEFSPQLLKLNLAKGKVDIDNLKAGIDLYNSQSSLIKEKIITEQSQQLVNNRNADYIVENTKKNILEQATEQLKQANIKVTNKKIAQEIKKIELEQGLISIQQILFTEQTELSRTQQEHNIQLAETVNLDNLEKEWELEYRNRWGSKPGKTLFGESLQAALGWITNSRNFFLGF